MPAPLTDVRIDETTWEAGSHERRLEWRTALRDLLECHHFDIAAPPFALVVTWQADQSAELVARVEGRELAALTLPAARMRPHYEEYIDICKKMNRLAGNRQSPQLEAFDIAKRIAHDEAGETVCEMCRPLRPDHATGRRLFTLLVTLHTDTTRMAIPQHIHRRDDR